MIWMFQVILPQASEEYGPISHYFLVVVPEDKTTMHKNPDEFLTDDVSIYSRCIVLNVVQEMTINCTYVS